MASRPGRLRSQASSACQMHTKLNPSRAIHNVENSRSCTGRASSSAPQARACATALAFIQRPPVLPRQPTSTGSATAVATTVASIITKVV